MISSKAATGISGGGMIGEGSGILSQRKLPCSQFLKGRTGADGLVV